MPVSEVLPEGLTEGLNMVVWGNTLEAYGVALGCLVLGLIAIAFLQRIVLQRLHRLASRTPSPLDDRLVTLTSQPIVGLLRLGVIFLSVSNLSVYPTLARAFTVICVALGTLMVVQLVVSLLEYGIRVYWLRHRASETVEQSLNAILPAIRVTVWAIGAVFLLDNIGFDVSAVVASLGIGGIAIAFAAQGVLADLFSYVAILLDRPFEIGDFIVTGNITGTVEQVGIKTTRIRSLSGEELVTSNTDLTNSRIQNFKRMQRRRVVFHIGIVYETPREKLPRVAEILEMAVKQVDGLSFDRAHFFRFGDFSLDYETVYFVETADYATYMNAQQAINLTLMERFAAEGIQFAYPTQVVQVMASSPNAAAPVTAVRRVDTKRE